MLDVDFHREDEDGMVKGKGLYNQMYPRKEF